MMTQAKRRLRGGAGAGSPSRRLVAVLVALVPAIFPVPPVWADAGGQPEELKVCADPFNLPFSNKEGKGFENRLAELFAEELGVSLRYEWFPQRRGFVRNTLKSELSDGVYKCDLIVGVPSGFELAATTVPYYRSTYVMIYARGRGMDEVQTPGELSDLPQEVRQKLRFGVFDQGPGQLWVFREGFMAQAVPYVAQGGDARVTPSQVIDDLIEGKIDVTIIWGPFGGYYAKRHRDGEKLVVLPMAEERDSSLPNMRFQYDISMAVRYGEKEWRERVNGFIRENRSRIDEVLDEFGIPRVELKE